MSRQKRYETAAQKQKAYRARKKNQIEPEKSKDDTLERLRGLIKEEKPVVEEPMRIQDDPDFKRGATKSAKPQVFRNDYGGVISERAWNQLQKKKEAAKAGGYELDEWSQ